MTNAKHAFIGCLAVVSMLGCETSTQPALKDQTVLWGLVATGNTPYFEFWQNTSTDSKMLDPNEFVLYMEDLSDSSHTKYYFQNGIGKGLVIKANTSYKIVWHKSQSNEIHSITKRTPPAFDPNMFKNINRTHVKVSTDVNLADDELYNIAIFNRFTKRVKNNGTYYYLNYFAPRAETILQLQNYPGSLALWPCKYLQSVSFNGQCEKYVDGNFRFDQSVTLCVVSVEDEENVRKISEQSIDYQWPSLLGEKIRYDYESGDFKAIIPFVSPDNVGKFYDYIPKKASQSLKILDVNGLPLDTNKFNIVWATMHSNGSSNSFFGSDKWNRNRNSEPIYFDRDDLYLIFNCEHDPRESFTFEIILDIKNKSNSTTKQYIFRNLMFEDKDKVHVLQLY
ncbi:MAG: hypothetical protein RLZZ512_1326 [Bacteroidota bacterium]|jgi:hypothetical protein